MPVYDRSYRRWDGELRRHSMRWLPITSAGLRHAMRARRNPVLTVMFFTFLLGSQAPFVVLLLANYAYHFPPEKLLPPEALDALSQLEPYQVVQYPLLVWLWRPVLMIFTVLFGCELIARDRSVMALPLYRSRPLTLADYVLGKFGVLAFYLSCLTLFPCLLLWLFNAVASDTPGALLDSLPVLGAILVHTLTTVFVFSLTMLAASAVCKRPMVASVLWFGGMMILGTVTTGLRYALDSPRVMALSPTHASLSLAYEYFGLESIARELNVLDTLQNFGVERHMSPPLAWLSILSYCLGSLWVVVRSVKKVDI